MKVMFVLHGFPPEMSGGTERTVEAVARAMQSAGHEVVVVAGSIQLGASDAPVESDRDGLRVVRLHRQDLYFEDWNKAWSPAVSAAFGRLVDAERPDVVHVQHWLRLTTDLARVARAAACAPVVAVTLHDFFATCATPARLHDDPVPPVAPVGGVRGCVGDAERAEALADHRDDFVDELAAADLRYVPSAAHGEGLRATAPAAIGPMRVLAPPLLERPARSAADDPRGKRLVTWGSLYPEKGLDLVLEALASIGSGWSLDVYGVAHDPEYQDRLAARVATLAVTAEVRLHGAFEPGDLPAAASAADYAVFPSQCAESYGLTIDEARCLGLPMLCADLPAYREHAPTESTAFFAPGDAGALAMLLVDEPRLAALTRPAAPDLPTPASIAETLLADYRAAAGTAPAAQPPRMSTPRRLRALFRRAERRTWTAIQSAAPPPPDDTPPD